MPADTAAAALAATDLLLKQRLYSLQIDVTALRYDKNIIFDSFFNFCRNTCATLEELTRFRDMRDGCTIRRYSGENIVYIVLYNEKVESFGRRRFTLAHEIGHIYLEHESDGFDEEHEADHFAAQLLMPSILVWELLGRNEFTISPRDIAGIFSVSKITAENRIRTLKRRNPPEFSESDRLLLDRFGWLLPQIDGPIVDC